MNRLNGWGLLWGLISTIWAVLIDDMVLDDYVKYSCNISSERSYLYQSKLAWEGNRRYTDPSTKMVFALMDGDRYPHPDIVKETVEEQVDKRTKETLLGFGFMFIPIILLLALGRIVPWILQR